MKRLTKSTIRYMIMLNLIACGLLMWVIHNLDGDALYVTVCALCLCFTAIIVGAIIRIDEDSGP